MGQPKPVKYKEASEIREVISRDRLSAAGGKKTNTELKGYFGTDFMDFTVLSKSKLSLARFLRSLKRAEGAEWDQLSWPESLRRRFRPVGSAFGIVLDYLGY
jgi:hypothetical protein